MSPFAPRLLTLNATHLGNESAPAADEVQLVIGSPSLGSPEP